MRLLLVEDDERFASTLVEMLKDEAYVVECAANRASACEFLELYEYDLLILDVQLPDGDGRDLCQTLRQQGVTRPILLLTVWNSSDDRVRGLDAGADDYLTKPVKRREFLAKIRALLRRAGHELPDGFVTELRCRNLRLNLQTRKTYCGEQQLDLTPKQTLLLECFLRHPRQKMSWQTIADWVYAADSELRVAETVRSHVRGLRRQLQSVGLGDLICNDYGIGYYLNADTVEWANSTEEQSPDAGQDLDRYLRRYSWEQHQDSIREDVAALVAFYQALATCAAQLPALQQRAHDLAGLLDTLLGRPGASEAAANLEQLLWQADLLAHLPALEAQLQQLREAIAAPPD